MRDLVVLILAGILSAGMLFLIIPSWNYNPNPSGCSFKCLQAGYPSHAIAGEKSQCFCTTSNTATEMDW